MTSVDDKLTLAEKISGFIAFQIFFVPPILFVLTIFFAPSAIIIRALIIYVTFAVWSECGFQAQLFYGNPWRRFSEDNPIFAISRNYLRLSFGPIPKELIEAEKKKDAQFIFAAFPHGCNSEFRILIEGLLQNILPNMYRKLRVLAATVLFRIPIIREITLWTSCVDANRKTAERNLDQGNSLMVLPGGEVEQLMTEYGKEKIYLLNRKGFIKMAMRKRVPVVPMYVFGSSDMFYTSKFLYGPRYWLMKNFGICIPLGRGMFGSPMCPLPKKVTVIFGAPLVFKMEGLDPTEKELDIAHSRFLKGLQLLFDKHKASCGYGDRDLEIF